MILGAAILLGAFFALGCGFLAEPLHKMADEMRKAREEGEL